PLTGKHLDRLPPDPAVVGGVVQLDAPGPGWQGRCETRLDASQRETALTRWEGEARIARCPERNGMAGGQALEIRGDLGSLVRQQGRLLATGDRSVTVPVEALDLLERWDLGLIEDVVDLHRSLVDPNLAQMVDREVAKRMRGGRVGPCRGDQQRRGHEEPDE